jgi:hypothetical protein
VAVDFLAGVVRDGEDQHCKKMHVDSFSNRSDLGTATSIFWVAQRFQRCGNVTLKTRL